MSQDNDALAMAKRMTRHMTLLDAWNALRKAYPAQTWTDKDIDDMLIKLHHWANGEE